VEQAVSYSDLYSLLSGLVLLLASRVVHSCLCRSDGALCENVSRAMWRACRERSVNTTATRLTVEHLKPSTGYTFQVAAFDSVAVGYETASIDVLTPSSRGLYLTVCTGGATGYAGYPCVKLGMVSIPYFQAFHKVSLPHLYVFSLTVQWSTKFIQSYVPANKEVNNSALTAAMLYRYNHHFHA